MHLIGSEPPGGACYKIRWTESGAPQQSAGIGPRGKTILGDCGVALYPGFFLIARQTPLTESQNPGPQVGNMPARHDQKAAVETF
ncbi:MAG: hypothetical protein DMG30_00705 [Acidobacteria bacterium]|nr:MAG: hypothetical protein DMG30_00705 [Acidobacteriota bacterium]